MEHGVAELSPRDWRAQALSRPPLFAEALARDLDASHADVRGNDRNPNGPSPAHSVQAGLGRAAPSAAR